MSELEEISSNLRGGNGKGCEQDEAMSPRQIHDKNPDGLIPGPVFPNPRNGL